MRVSYYPGCTLKSNARNFEDSALFLMNALDVQVQELSRWNCCGTVFSLTSDDLIHHVAPIRNLIRAKEAKTDSLVTLCAMCYNTLKRSNMRMRDERDNLEVLNNFMDREEVEYHGEVDVFHLLELLRDKITFKHMSEKVKKPLKGLKVASYYGCMLMRPKEVGFDDMENPTILENFTESLGAKAIDFPYKTECCASYQTVDKPEVVATRTNQILSNAIGRGADIVSVSCPLCAFNLDHRQKETAEKFPGFKNIPILYFTQLGALALGCSEEKLKFDLHYVDPKLTLKEKGLI